MKGLQGMDGFHYSVEHTISRSTEDMERQDLLTQTLLKQSRGTYNPKSHHIKRRITGM